jgi:hypothetical protein
MISWCRGIECAWQNFQCFNQSDLSGIVFIFEANDNGILQPKKSVVFGIIDCSSAVEADMILHGYKSLALLG